MAMATMAVAAARFFPGRNPEGENRFLLARSSRAARLRHGCCKSKAFRVEFEHEGQTHLLQVEEDETILEKALELGLDVPHDCKLGVCMTCPAKLEKGRVDQSQGMLSDDVVEKGYALLCVSQPQSDCKIRTIPEDELVSLQLVTSAD